MSQVIKYPPGYYVFINQLLEKAVYLAFYIVLARITSSTDYGIVITIFAFSNIIQILLDFGLPFYIQREFAAEKQDSINLNSIFSLKLISLPVILTIELIYLSFIQGINQSWVLVIGIANYLQSINQLYNSIFYGLGFYSEPFKHNLISKLFFMFLVGILIYLKSGILFIVSSLMLSNVMIIIIQRNTLVSKNILKNKNKFSLANLKNILPSSLRIGASQIFVTIYDRADILILQLFVNYEDVASYAVAYSLFRSLQIFGTAVLIPAYTKYSAIFTRENILKFHHVRKELYFLITISFFLLAGIEIFGKLIIGLFYGENYIYSGTILILIGTALPGVYLNNLTGVISNASRRENIPVITTGTGVLIGIGFNFALIPVIGIFGAVITTIITEYAVFLFQFIYLVVYNKNRTLLISSSN